MTPTQHANDASIQEYVINKNNCSSQLVAHIQQCPECQAKATAYALIISAIQEQPAPVFDFNVTELVMPQLPQLAPPVTAKKFPLLPVLLGAAVLLVIPVYFFLTSLQQPLPDDFYLSLYFLIPVALAVLTLHILETYKKHQKQLMTIQ
jgi:hypothetical protein